MDISLHYSEQGSGKPLILLHGNNENGEYFVNQIPELSKHRHVFIIDTRGHGKSPRGNAPFTLNQFADDLYNFVKNLDIEKADILGYSDGANIAILFALSHPEMVSSLILNGANLSPAGIKALYQITVCLGFALISLISVFDKRAVREKEMLRLMVKEPHIRPESLEGLTVPSLVIVGNNDLVKEKHSRLIADSLPDSRFVVLDGGHNIAEKNSIEFNKAVLSFLS